MPKVSVIMPLYNKSLFLREALSSILAQTFQDFELIVIDDKSTDDSVAVLGEFKDKRIHFFSNTRNLGQANTLNNGIEKATGKYVTFAHGDDIWLDCFLERHVTLMEQHCSVNLSHARAHMIDENGTVSLTHSLNIDQPYSVTGFQDVLFRLMKGSYPTTPTVLLRNGTFPLFNNRFVFACDWDLWLRIAVSGSDFLYIDEPLIYYRNSLGNATSLASKSGVNIIEDYLVLSGFFVSNPVYCQYKGMALRRLSMSTLRRSRYVQSRDTIFLYQKFAAAFSPTLLLNPLFYIYLITGILFGHKGLCWIKQLSKALKPKLHNRISPIS